MGSLLKIIFKGCLSRSFLYPDYNKITLYFQTILIYKNIHNFTFFDKTNLDVKNEANPVSNCKITKRLNYSYFQ